MTLSPKHFSVYLLRTGKLSLFSYIAPINQIHEIKHGYIILTDHIQIFPIVQQCPL